MPSILPSALLVSVRKTVTSLLLLLLLSLHLGLAPGCTKELRICRPSERDKEKESRLRGGELDTRTGLCLRVSSASVLHGSGEAQRALLARARASPLAAEANARCPGGRRRKKGMERALRDRKGRGSPRQRLSYAVLFHCIKDCQPAQSSFSLSLPTFLARALVSHRSFLSTIDR